jgi:superoxide dismutase, Cu-Zn family
MPEELLYLQSSCGTILLSNSRNRKCEKTTEKAIMSRKAFAKISLALVTLVFTGHAFTNEGRLVEFINIEGENVGQAKLMETPNGVLIKTNLHSLPPGWHAFHIHETGACTVPDFTSAGGHYNPEAQAHGFKCPEGPHAGDLPNVLVGPDGRLEIEVLAPRVTLRSGPNTLLDENGSALILHAGVDDYRSQPAGDAGGRITCGAIR